MPNYFINDKGQAQAAGTVKLANTYPHSKLILIHWGTVDAPEMTPFNGNPDNVIKNVVNPERVKILKPGEEFIVK